ncbi:MAG: helix-turn-helix domain-containing protein [bacterium]
MDNQEILTMKEAAAYLKITEKTLLKLVKENKVRALRVGNVYRFIKKELTEDVREKEAKVATR